MHDDWQFIPDSFSILWGMNKMPTFLPITFEMHFLHSKMVVFQFSHADSKVTH